MTDDGSTTTPKAPAGKFQMTPTSKARWEDVLRLGWSWNLAKRNGFRMEAPTVEDLEAYPGILSELDAQFLESEAESREGLGRVSNQRLAEYRDAMRFELRKAFLADTTGRPE